MCFITLTVAILAQTCRYLTRKLIVNHHQKMRLIKYDVLQFVGLSQLSRQTEATINALTYVLMFVNVILSLFQ